MLAEPRWLTIRAAILLGFGITLGLWLWAGYDFVRRMAEVHREAAAINLRYMEAQELLATVRPQVLIVSVNARTALLDPESGHRNGYRDRIRTALEAINNTLQHYVPVLDSRVEQERLARLHLEIASFGETVLGVLADDRAATPNEARNLLDRILPRRELVIGVTDEVQALNRAAFVQEQTSIGNAYRQMQTRILERLGLALAGSLGVALWAVVYSGRLERRLRDQQEKEAQHTRDLTRLSAKLIDAQEQERRSIARELHDELGQAIEAIKVELTLAQGKVRADGGGDLLADAQSITQGLLHTVRDLSHLLHPAVLDDLGLVAAVESYLRAFGKRHVIRARFSQERATTRFGPDIEIAAYRIVQEALTNIARHAAAASCSVAVRHVNGRLLIVIEDDGCGFDPAVVAQPGVATGLGLIGIRERVGQLQGQLRVESAVGRGTTVIVELPIVGRGIDPGRDDADATISPRLTQSPANG